MIKILTDLTTTLLSLSFSYPVHKASIDKIITDISDITQTLLKEGKR